MHASLCQQGSIDAIREGAFLAVVESKGMDISGTVGNWKHQLLGKYGGLVPVQGQYLSHQLAAAMH